MASGLPVVWSGNPADRLSALFDAHHDRLYRPGLREARIAGSDLVVYLHQEIIVTNDEIAQSSVVQGAGPSRFGINVQFNTAGTQKMRQATASHVGRPVAILIDGEVVAAPVLRSPISTSAVISGNYTKAEAETIVNGIGIR